MPEGHTLRRLADDLTAAFGGRVVGVSSPTGRFGAEAAQIDGHPLLAADSAGKHLFAEFPGDLWVHVHLGLIGKFEVHTGLDAVPLPKGQVRLRLTATTAAGQHAPEMFSYADLRGATQCELVGTPRRDAILDRLGPDPLRVDADPGRAWQRIRRSPRPIGDLLMDQEVLAGVGNVYRAEVLFRHRMHPLRPGRSLRSGQFRGIWDDLVVLMAEGVATGRIDTVRTEHTPEATGRPARVDDHGGEVYVYRRAGLACHVCGSRIRTDLLVGRNTFWCPRCQPTFRSRAQGDG